MILIIYKDENRCDCYEVNINPVLSTINDKKLKVNVHFFECKMNDKNGCCIWLKQYPRKDKIDKKKEGKKSKLSIILYQLPNLA
jgi:uncharacterized membrane protein